MEKPEAAVKVVVNIHVDLAQLYKTRYNLFNLPPEGHNQTIIDVLEICREIAEIARSKEQKEA